jgi:hypothetical protein
MTETRTKIYHSLQQQRRDEAEAAAFGWTVLSRDSGPEGYRVTYQLGSSWGAPTEAPPRRGGIRRATVLFILWNLLVAGLLVLLMAPGVRSRIDDVVGSDVATVSQATLASYILVVWVVGLLVTSLIWLLSRPRRR